MSRIRFFQVDSTQQQGGREILVEIKKHGLGVERTSSRMARPHTRAHVSIIY
jgi:hypothetical protein